MKRFVYWGKYFSQNYEKSKNYVNDEKSWKCEIHKKAENHEECLTFEIICLL